MPPSRPNTGQADADAVFGSMSAPHPGQADADAVFGTPAPRPAYGLPPSLDDPAALAEATAAARRAETFPTTGARQEVPYDLAGEQARYERGLAKDIAATGISVAGTAGGAALGGLTSPVTGPVGPVVGAAAGSLAARKANVALGFEEPGTLGDVVSAAAPVIPAVPVLARAGKNLVVRAAGAGAQGAIDTAATKTAAQAARLAEAEAAAMAANDAAQVAYRAKGAAVANDARLAAQAAQQRYEAELAAYQSTVMAQETAVGTARSLPATARPETPSWVTYQKLRDVAPTSPVNITQAQEAASRLTSELGERLPTAQPSRLQSLLSDIQERETTTTLAVVHEDLKVLGPLTRSGDSTTRRVAKQLYGALQESLEASADQLPATAAGRDLLRTANAAARREFAVQDLEQLVRRAVTIGDDGLPRLAPGRLLTQLDRLAESDAMFRGSFTPAELTSMRADFARLAGTPKIPARAPQAPVPVIPKDVGPAPAPVVPARLASLRARPPVEPDYPSPSGARILAEIGTGLGGGVLTGHPITGAVVGGATASADYAYAVLSRALLTPRGRAILAAAHEPGGRISPTTLAALAEVVKLPTRYTSKDQRPGR